jgi:hypothetical protein
MYNSLNRVCKSFSLHIICLDDKLFDQINGLKKDNISAHKLSDVEKVFPELHLVKQEREYVDYIFTLSPFIALYILKQLPNIDRLITLDADIYFFSDPAIELEKYNKYSVLITPHNFRKDLIRNIKYGKYNVSFQLFKNDDIGISCLEQWKTDCLNWCFDYLEGGKFADQKYLDNWINNFSKVGELGINFGLAPWNFEEKKITYNHSTQELYYDQEKLILFHFHGVRNLNKRIFSIGLANYFVFNRPKAIELIYKPYIRELLSNSSKHFKITRKMYLNLGRVFYYLFVADLYVSIRKKLYRIPNFNYTLFFKKLIKS